MIDIVIEQQTAHWTDSSLAVKDNRFTILLRADEHRTAMTAVMLSLFLFFANRTLFHNIGPLKTMTRKL